MADIFGNKNQHTFIWKFKNVDVFSLLDMKEIRSPLFTTEHLGGASWFLSVHDYSKQNKKCGFLCSLNRYSEDEGIDEIRIQWRLKVFACGNECLNQEDDSIVYEFKKGYSVSRGVKTKSALSWLNLITVEVTNCSSTEKPIFGTTIVQTEGKSITWYPQNISEIKLISGNQDIQYEAGFTVSKRYFFTTIMITLRRCDCNSSIYCYKQFWFKILHNGRADIIRTEEKQDHKVFNVNDVFNFPTTLKMKQFLDSKEVNFIFIHGKFLTSTVVTDIQASNCEDKYVAVSFDHKLNTTDILRTEQLRMYEDKIHSDVTLQIGKEAFSAHKCILASRSPVFAAMFERDMVETQSGMVTITDMDVPTMDSLLKYMYTMVVEELDYESALKLLMAADKYQIFSLKQLCSNHLSNALTDEKILEVFVVADMISYSELKESAMKYMKIHSREVLKSNSWKQFVETNANLATEILICISDTCEAITDKNWEKMKDLFVSEFNKGKFNVSRGQMLVKKCS